MKAVRYHTHGGPEVLRLEEVPVPEPGPGQVLIEVEAVGANAIDTVFRRGGGPWQRPLPGRLTGDVVGRVVALGPAAAAPPVAGGAGARGGFAAADGGVAVGARVAALCEDAFAEFVVADAQWVAPVPDRLDAGTATVLSMTAPLALRLLLTARVGRGDTVLVQSAAGGVGHLAVQLARHLGAATVVGVASTAVKREFVASLGAVAVADLDEARHVAPGGVDVVLDAVGGAAFDAGLELLAPLGRMVTYGAIGGSVPTLAAHALYAVKSVTGLSLVAWRAARPEAARADITDATALVRSGAVRPATYTMMPMTDVHTAHELLDARANLGRIVLTVG